MFTDINSEDRSMEPVVFEYAERHGNLETLSKKLQERRDTSDVTELLKELHKIVNEAIRTQGVGDDHAVGLTVNLSRIDSAKLQKEFAKKVKRKRKTVQDLRDLIEQKLQAMLARNPLRMDDYKRYQEIVAGYNRQQDRVAVEEAFVQLAALARDLDAEQRQAVEEGLSDDEFVLFEMLLRDDVSKANRERLKPASCQLVASVQGLISQIDRFWEREQTQAEVKVFILDQLVSLLPDPPYSPDDGETANCIYEYVWQRCAAGQPLEAVAV